MTAPCHLIPLAKTWAPVKGHSSVRLGHWSRESVTSKNHSKLKMLQFSIRTWVFYATGVLTHYPSALCDTRLQKVRSQKAKGASQFPCRGTCGSDGSAFTALSRNHLSTLSKRGLTSSTVRVGSTFQKMHHNASDHIHTQLN